MNISDISMSVSTPLSLNPLSIDHLQNLQNLQNLPQHHLLISNTSTVTMNMNDIYMMTCFAFMYVLCTIGVLTMILLYQEEVDRVQSLSIDNINDINDINVIKILKMYAKFIFTLTFFILLRYSMKIYYNF